MNLWKQSRCDRNSVRTDSVETVAPITIMETARRECSIGTGRSCRGDSDSEEAAQRTNREGRAESLCARPSGRRDSRSRAECDSLLWQSLTAECRRRVGRGGPSAEDVYSKRSECSQAKVRHQLSRTKQLLMNAHIPVHNSFTPLDFCILLFSSFTLTIPFSLVCSHEQITYGSNPSSC